MTVMRLLAPLATALLLPITALAQQPRPVPPASLAEAVARAPDTVGWRTQPLADGRIAAIGTGAVAGAVHVVGVACGTGKVPEIAAAARGGPPARALLLADDDATKAFPLDAPRGAEAADALLFEAEAGEGPELRLQLDGETFPARGARAAIAQVAKDCRRLGWDYANDDERQLIWLYRPTTGEGPVLMFAKPDTGWLLAQFACDRRARTLIVRSTLLPRRARSGQTLPLTLRAGGQDFAARGRVQKFDGGDVEGFLVARFDKPAALLARLREPGALVLRTDKESMTVSAHGLGALLPKFVAACGLQG